MAVRAWFRPELLLLLFTGALLNLARAGETMLKDWFKRPILASGQSQTEFEQYCGVRAPRMPTVTTREQWELPAERIRAEMLEKVVYRGQAAAWRDAQSQVAWLDTIEGGEGYRIRKLRYEALPGLFCLGLLERFDMLQLAALVAPRPVHFTTPSAAHERELQILKTWYATLGTEFDPLR